jgi:hypothetical protein
VRTVREREEMTGWDSRIQRRMGPCIQAQCTSVSLAVSTEWEGEGEKEAKQGKSKD